MDRVRVLTCWLTILALAFAGMFERGFVLCLGSDGSVRVEAAVNGTCQLPVARATVAATTAALLGVPPSTHSCEDVGLVSGSVGGLQGNQEIDSLPMPPLQFASLPTLSNQVPEPSSSALPRPVNGDEPNAPRQHWLRRTVALLI